jgi:ParB/RepB/Spo0J family partition protein
VNRIDVATAYLNSSGQAIPTSKDDSKRRIQMHESELRLIPLSEIKTRGTNPRTLFEEAKLKELADDIKVHGILQPLVVRPVDGQYELVAGERRLRAAKLAELTTVPATVRELTDLEADEIQVVENAQRVDLNYVEQADAFDRLRRVHGLDVKQISAKTGKPAGYVNFRLQLVGLSPTVRKAALERNSALTPGYAALIAKINDHASQDRFLAEILKGDYSNKPLKLKDAEQRLESTYQIALSKATFNTNDAALYPPAGSCGVCPFNTTNLDRTIYKDKEICTKPTCFKEKEKRRFDQLAATAKDEGVVVISPKKAEAIFDKHQARAGRDHVLYSSDFINVDEESYNEGYGHTKLRAILKGDTMPQLHITRGPSGKTVYLVNRKDADAARDKIRRSKTRQESLKSPQKSAAEKQSELRDKAGKRASASAVQKIVDSVERLEVPDTLRKPLMAILAGVGGYQHEEDLVAAIKRREILDVDVKNYTKRRAAIGTFWTKHASKLELKTLLGLCVETSLGTDHYHRYSKPPFSRRLTEAAKIFRIDLNALQKEELKALQRAEREKAAKKKTSKKTATKKKR